MIQNLLKTSLAGNSYKKLLNVWLLLVVAEAESDNVLSPLDVYERHNLLSVFFHLLNQARNPFRLVIVASMHGS